MEIKNPEMGGQINKEYELLRQEIAGIKELNGIDLNSIPDEYLELYKKYKNQTLTVEDINKYRPRIDLVALTREHPELLKKDRTLTIEDIEKYMSSKDFLVNVDDSEPKKNFIAFLANQMSSPEWSKEKK